MSNLTAAARPPLALRRARLATATLFFANGCRARQRSPRRGAAALRFAGVGLALANVAPIVFSAAGQLPGLAPGIGIAAVSTAGFGGFLAGPPLIGLVAELGGLLLGLGLVAAAVLLMLAGAGALRPRAAGPAEALAGS